MKKNIFTLLLILFCWLDVQSQWSALPDVNNLVSATAYDQFNPKIINDGTGGYIISWTEKNPTDYNVWAQKLNANGAPQWGVNGVAVCTTTDHQILSGLVSDGAGGAIIVWEDSAGTGGGGSHGMNDVFAQRLSSTGTKMWATNGVSICSATDLQSNVSIISDNSNGAFIVWHDYRNNGYIGSDIYAQRINSSGVVQWLTDGILICGATNPQIRPRLCTDGAGGAYITWEDYRLYSQSEIYVQRINASGTALFTTDGVIACTAANDQLFPEIISDGAGGAFLSWYDKRVNGSMGVGDLYGQRINASGSILWGTAGSVLCDATGDQFTSFANLPCMTGDGSNGFYFVWNDLRNGSHNVYMQRFNAGGTALWTANGVAVNNSPWNELYPSVVLDGMGGTYVTWDRYGNATVDIYAQRMDGNGNALWVANGIPVGNAINSQYNNQLVAKGDGTAIVVFNDKRNNSNFDIYAQRLVAAGTCTPPNVVATANTTNVCSGGSVTLSVTGTDSYLWTNLGTGSTKVVTPTSTTVYTVTATATDGCTNTSTVTVNVLNLPTVSITPSSTGVCPGGSVTLTGTGANTYVWSNNATTTSITVSPAATATYSVTGTSSNGCTATSSTTIIMNTPPVISITPTVATVCLGSSATITASGAQSYLWNTGITTAALTISPSVTTTYTVTGTGSNSCSATATKTMNVNNLPNIVVTPANASICLGGSITLTATGAGSYTWTGIGTGAIKTVSPTTTTIYTITGTSGTGCSNTTTKTVTVNPLPSITITPASGTICSGQSLTLLAEGGNTYLWSNNSSTTSSQTVSPVSNTTYTVTGTSSAGCSSSTTSIINVNTAPTVSISPSTITLCAGTSTNLTAVTTNCTFQWVGYGTNNIQSVSPTVTTTYTVIATNAQGCTASATQTVNVLSAPSVSITPSTSTICSGTTTTLTASGAITYNWTTLGTNATQSVSPTTTSTYTVTGTNSSGCTSTSTAVVNVNQNPVTTITPTNAINLCQGSNITLTASGANTYSWTALGSGASQTVSPATTTTYTVTGTSSTGCTSSATKTVTVNSVPVVSISSTNSTICSGLSTNLNASAVNCTFQWVGLGTSAIQPVSPSVTTTYTVIATNAQGCTASAAQTINVLSAPTILITPSGTSICSGTATTLTASGASTYVWTNLGTTAAQSVSPLSTTTYTVTGTNASGCTSTSTATVIVNSNPIIVINPTTAVTLCQGSSVLLTASGANTYSWTALGSGASKTVSPITTTIYTVTGTNSSGCTSSATKTITVNTVSPISISSTNTSICAGSSSTLTPSGALTYVWTGLPSGTVQTISPTVTTTYTVTGTSSNGCTTTGTVTVVVNNCNSVLTTKCLVQGYYVGNGLMTPVLFNQFQSSNANICDSVTISLRSTTVPYNVIFSHKVAMNLSGIANWTLPSAAVNSSYYLTLEFRNAIQVWSANPITISGNLTYDFSTSANKAYGNNLVLIDPALNLYGTYSGDINQDQTIDTFDYLMLDPDIFSGNGGYLNTDINGDGSTDTFDYLVLAPNVYDGIGAAGPQYMMMLLF